METRLYVLPVVMLEFEAPYSMGLWRMREFIVFFLIECIYVTIKLKKRTFLYRILKSEKKNVKPVENAHDC